MHFTGVNIIYIIKGHLHLECFCSELNPTLTSIPTIWFSTEYLVSGNFALFILKF